MTQDELYNTLVSVTESIKGIEECLKQLVEQNCAIAEAIKAVKVCGEKTVEKEKTTKKKTVLNEVKE